MDIQILLIFILAVLVITIVAVAIYAIVVLKELRITIQKANGIIENVQSITNAIANPLTVAAAVFKGIKLFRNLKQEEE